MTTRDPLAPAFGALTAAGIAFRVVEAAAVAAGRADLELAAPDVAAAVAALTPLWRIRLRRSVLFISTPGHAAYCRE